MRPVVGVACMEREARAKARACFYLWGHFAARVNACPSVRARPEELLQQRAVFGLGFGVFGGDDDGGGDFAAGVEVRRGRGDQVGELAFSSRSMSSMVTPASHWGRSAV